MNDSLSENCRASTKPAIVARVLKMFLGGHVEGIFINLQVEHIFWISWESEKNIYDMRIKKQLRSKYMNTSNKRVESLH